MWHVTGRGTQVNIKRLTVVQFALQAPPVFTRPNLPNSYKNFMVHERRNNFVAIPFIAEG